MKKSNCKIYMLHRVYPFENNKLFPNENMKVSPAFLEQFILKKISDGFEFISLNKLYELLKNFSEDLNNKLVLTLDDGYKDNFTHAYPIFKKHNIPFAIYLTTSFPEKQAILWWYALEDLIINNNTIELCNGEMFSCNTEEQKNSTFMKIRSRIMKLEQKNLLNNLNNLFCKYRVNWQCYTERLTLDWSDIVIMSNDQLCTIAGHTLNHYVLSKLNSNDVENEVMNANKLIESCIKKDIKHFAYPFGDSTSCTDREYKIVKKMSILTATTTSHGNIEKGANLMALKRVMLCEGKFL